VVQDLPRLGRQDLGRRQAELVDPAQPDPQRQREQQSRDDHCEVDERGTRSQAGRRSGIRHDLRRGRLPRGQGRRQRIAAGKRGRHRQHRSRTPGRIALEAAHDRALDRRIQVPHQVGRALGIGVGAGAHGLRQRLAFEGLLAGEDLVEHEPERIDVAPSRDLPALELLRRHVGRGAAADVARRDLLREGGQAEVRDHHVAAAVEHHVRGLEVTVEDTLVVRGGEARADLPRHLQRLVRRQPADAAEERGQILAVHVLHGEERPPVRLADVVHAADVRVRDLARDLHFLTEAFQPVRVVRRFGEELEGDRLVEGEVVGAVDLAHPAAAEQGDDPVPAREYRARNEPALAGCGCAAARPRRCRGARRSRRLRRPRR
jgi:hypothetical protein